jgi:thioredoxin
MKTYLKLLLLGAILFGNQVLIADENIDIFTNNNYLSKLQKSDKPTLVKFWASWCRACTTMNPEFAKASETMKGKVNFASVNVDTQDILADKYNIRSLPTVILFKKDKIVEMSIGSMNQEEIEDLVKKAL